MAFRWIAENGPPLDCEAELPPLVLTFPAPAPAPGAPSPAPAPGAPSPPAAAAPAAAPAPGADMVDKDEQSCRSTPQKPDHPPTRCRSQAKVWFQRPWMREQRPGPPPGSTPSCAA
uniref:Uncharacterized protein n=1 Tax=Oryza sativa subsp. indica TaxID=39946 RepID=A0A8F3AEE8_ORYSI|nr:hypothetical protein Xa7_IRBB7.26 [Oryza sativa Indica Group]